jgi:DegV family protein with EDD domain
MVRVVTDSIADIPPDMVAELGIVPVPAYVIFGAETYRDGVDLSRQQFYNRLRTTTDLPGTAAPPPAHYEEVYRRLGEETDEIISIHASSRLSAILNSATVAAEAVTGVRIEVIDSGQVTMGYGWLAVAAAEAAQEGAALDEIVALVEGLKPRCRVLAVLDTLEFLHRGGRVDWIQATLGTLLRIKPIIQVRDGEVALVERARTFRRSVARLLESVRALGVLERALVLHADAPAWAGRVADQLEEIIPDWERLITPAGVTIASHAGPGAVGVACVLA